ncbi:hypothetical protein PVT67_01765 [Gallaecimonas kandeliae]|uniref:hypothetical protein n=1 Tax=Gallaecimonas kandeliae TaxID=3029055 RepID=UPI0026482130|nr:hypothetical protein [Gallaecimonas kandeliae]WKE66000.1 hypothetical protein PVT67_01765 [Gallaecimonas kandeliae]
MQSTVRYAGRHEAVHAAISGFALRAASLSQCHRHCLSLRDRLSALLSHGIEAAVGRAVDVAM